MMAVTTAGVSAGFRIERSMFFRHGRAQAFGAGELISTIRMKGAQAHG